MRLPDIHVLPLNSTIATSGRIMSVRDSGGITFFDLVSMNNRVQCILHKKEHAVKITKGDLVEIEGYVTESRSGQKSIYVQKIKLVKSPTLLIPDVKYADSVDLAMKTDENASLYYLVNGECVVQGPRAVLMVERNIRNHLLQKQFEEIRTPILQKVASGAMARPFTTHHNFLNKEVELRVAPELMLKRAIIAGFEQIFEIGQCFRNEGASGMHLQEFTMLEAYSTITSDIPAEYVRWQQFAIDLLVAALTDLPGNQIELHTIRNMPISRYSDLFYKHVGYTLEQLQDDVLLKSVCAKHQVDLSVYKTKEDQLERLYKTLIRSQLISPHMVVDYPLMPLAKCRDQYTSYQFQIIVGTAEIVKACIEEDDDEKQKAKFAEQDSKKDLLNGEVAQTDTNFIECMKVGFPITAGIGIGINRLTQLALNIRNICDTVMFAI
jgi:lysyl-tRNA synthetase class 2